MNRCSALRPLTALLTAALAGFAPVAAQAQTAGDTWAYRATLYGWFPSLDGTTAFPTGGGASASVDSDQIIGNLNFALMGSFGMKKGQWGLWTDLVYADIDGSKQSTLAFANAPDVLPVDVNADLSLGVKSWAWTLVGTYALAETADYSADLVFGTRLLDVEQALDWRLSASGPLDLSANGSKTVSADFWDALIGIKGLAYLGNTQKWFIPYHVDIGTGQSDLTWQINAGIGYRFDWGALVASWRYLDYDFESGDPIQSLTLSGPLIGASFEW